MAADGESKVVVGRLLWVGPATVAAAVLAVEGVRLAAALMLRPLPKGLGALNSAEPAIVTGVCVTAAVLVFLAVGHEAAHPVQTYRRIALGVLLVSFIPDVVLGETAAPGINLWPMAMIFAVMHVVAWAVTVTMLTTLTCVRGTTSDAAGVPVGRL
jgi:hypothetical protein